MSELRGFVVRADEAEREIKMLKLELEALASRGGGGLSAADENEKVPDELEKLRVENTKLRYRLGILRRATEAERERKWKCPEL